MHTHQRNALQTGVPPRRPRAPGGGSHHFRESETERESFNIGLLLLGLRSFSLKGETGYMWLNLRGTREGGGRNGFFGESGLLENEPTVPAEQAHTTRRQ